MLLWQIEPVLDVLQAIVQAHTKIMFGVIKICWTPTIEVVAANQWRAGDCLTGIAAARRKAASCRLRVAAVPTRVEVIQRILVSCLLTGTLLIAPPILMEHMEASIHLPA